MISSWAGELAPQTRRDYRLHRLESFRSASSCRLFIASHAIRLSVFPAPTRLPRHGARIELGESLLRRYRHCC
jgi:hypothetical protein